MLMFKSRFEITSDGINPYAEVVAISGSKKQGIKYNVFIFNKLTKYNNVDTISEWWLYEKDSYKVVPGSGEISTYHFNLDRPDTISAIATGLGFYDWLVVSFTFGQGHSTKGGWLEIYGFLVPMPL